MDRGQPHAETHPTRMKSIHLIVGLLAVIAGCCLSIAVQSYRDHHKPHVLHRAR